MELQSRIDLDSIPLNGTHSDSDESLTEDSSRRDVRDALSGLGYGREEIQLAMKNLPSNAEPSLLLKLALQELATVT